MNTDPGLRPDGLLDRQGRSDVEALRPSRQNDIVRGFGGRRGLIPAGPPSVDRGRRPDGLEVGPDPDDADLAGGGVEGREAWAVKIS